MGIFGKKKNKNKKSAEVVEVEVDASDLMDANVQNNNVVNAEQQNAEVNAEQKDNSTQTGAQNNTNVADSNQVAEANAVQENAGVQEIPVDTSGLSDEKKAAVANAEKKNAEENAEQKSVEASAEQKSAEANETSVDNSVAAEPQLDEFENVELNKYLAALEQTKKALAKSLSHYSEDYLAEIRKTEYYKQRLEYWTKYYAAQRDDAIQKDIANRIARSEVLGAMKVSVQTANEDNDTKTEVITIKNNKAANSVEDSKAKDENLTAQDKQNANEIAKTDSLVEKVDEKQKEELKLAKAKLTDSVSKYAHEILLENLAATFDDAIQDSRKAEYAYRQKDSKKSEYIAKKYDERLNLFNAAQNSLDAIYGNNYKRELKRGVASIQKNIEYNNEDPHLTSCGDMMVENLRTTYVDLLTKYITDRIVNSCETQNILDKAVITKKSVENLMKQIIGSANEKLTGNVKKMNDLNNEKFNKAQVSNDSKMESLKGKLSPEQKALKKALTSESYALAYRSIRLDAEQGKNKELLGKNSIQFLMERAVNSEADTILDFAEKDKLQDYKFNTTKAGKLAKKMIKLLNTNKEDLVIKIKTSEKEAQETQNQEEQQSQVEQQSQEKPQKREEPLYQYVSENDNKADSYTDDSSNVIRKMRITEKRNDIDIEMREREKTMSQIIWELNEIKDKKSDHYKELDKQYQSVLYPYQEMAIESFKLRDEYDKIKNQEKGRVERYTISAEDLDEKSKKEKYKEDEEDFVL